MADCVCCREGPERARHQLHEMIRTNGFAVIRVSDASPAYAYSIGLTRTFGIPEFIIMGDFAPDTINTIADGINELATATPEVFHQGRELGIGERLLGYVPVTVPLEELPISKLTEFYGNDKFELNQIVLFDKQGRLPWHNGFDEGWPMESGQVLLFDR